MTSRVVILTSRKAFLDIWNVITDVPLNVRTAHRAHTRSTLNVRSPRILIGRLRLTFNFASSHWAPASTATARGRRDGARQLRDLNTCRHGNGTEPAGKSTITIKKKKVSFCRWRHFDFGTVSTGIVLNLMVALCSAFNDCYRTTLLSQSVLICSWSFFPFL